MLIYEDHGYLIGEKHREFTADKMMFSNYCILTLAVIERELHIRKQTAIHVHIAAGLSLTWVSKQNQKAQEVQAAAELYELNSV